jgi:hypothetical protein
VVKRKIYDYFYLSRAEKTATAELKKYLNKNNLQFIQVTLESLVSDTELELKKINQFLRSNIKALFANHVAGKGRFNARVSH